MAIKFKRTREYQIAADQLITRQEQRAIDREIALKPDRYPIIPGTGGTRKMRARVAGSGKSGGLRVCLWYRSHMETVYLLYIYSKRGQADLTASDKKALKELIDEIRKSERR